MENAQKVINAHQVLQFQLPVKEENINHKQLNLIALFVHKVNIALKLVFGMNQSYRTAQIDIIARLGLLYQSQSQDRQEIFVRWEIIVKLVSRNSAKQEHFKGERALKNAKTAQLVIIAQKDHLLQYNALLVTTVQKKAVKLRYAKMEQ